jgi:hypothetical protein
MRLTGYDPLGTFIIGSGAIRVADPCYGLDTWCMGTLKNAKNGTWKAYVKRKDEGDWGVRNSRITIIHESAVVSKTKLKEQLKAMIGVDSGQAGFFDSDRNTWDDKQYDEVCGQTLETELSAGVIDRGAVSSSGVGDGTYHCFYGVDEKGEVIAAEIRFL